MRPHAQNIMWSIYKVLRFFQSSSLSPNEKTERDKKKKKKQENVLLVCFYRYGKSSAENPTKQMRMCLNVSSHETNCWRTQTRKQTQRLISHNWSDAEWLNQSSQSHFIAPRQLFHFTRFGFRTELHNASLLAFIQSLFGSNIVKTLTTHFNHNICTFVCRGPRASIWYKANDKTKSCSFLAALNAAHPFAQT